MSGLIGEVKRNSGIISAPSFAMLKLSDSQSVTSGTMTKIGFDEMYGGSHGSISSDGWLVPESAMYKVDLQLSCFSGSNNIESIYCYVALDSTTHHGGYLRSNMSSRHDTANCTGILRANAGQIIYGYGITTATSPYFYHDSGTTTGRNTSTMVITFLEK